MYRDVFFFVFPPFLCVYLSLEHFRSWYYFGISTYLPFYFILDAPPVLLVLARYNSEVYITVHRHPSLNPLYHFYGMPDYQASETVIGETEQLMDIKNDA